MTLTHMMYDAIIVGARCAGASTALLLARQGARVLLVDRATFPSDTISGHAIRQPGVAYLKRWGLLESVVATGAPAIYDVTLAVGNQVLPPPDPGPSPLPVIGPRRTIFDHLLVEAAATAGVDVLEGTSVSAVLGDGQQVYGIEARRSSGRPLRARAPIVVGADGKHSFIAHQVGAEYEYYQAPVSIAYYTYWTGARTDGLTLAFQPGKAAGMFPTNDGQTLAFVQVRWGDRFPFRADAMGNYLATLRCFPIIAAALEGAVHETPLRGMLDLPTYFRKSYGPGWVLVGDAAHHQDPLIARGMPNAFRDADLLSETLSASLGGETDLMPALARYHERRDAASRTVSMLNHRLAELPEDLDETQRRLVELLQAEARIDAELAVQGH